MADFRVLEPAIDPNNRITFLLDWELTMKCNLDCSYCGSGLWGGHDNSTKHPSLADCLNTIDFMFEYADLYMSVKPNGIKYVILNVYGGEALHHPDIVDILQAVKDRYDRFKNKWHLTVTTTTNAIISKKKLDKIIPLIDEFTCSYHSEISDQKKIQFRSNLSSIKQANVRLKCVIPMHADPVLFLDSQQMISWCQENKIPYLPKQLDHAPDRSHFAYDSKQIVWFKSLYESKSYNNTMPEVDLKKINDDRADLSDSGRACCGGRQLCINGNQKSRVLFVENKFPDWYCSVNEFFLYVKQVNKEIYVNKDCKMDFQNKVGPIGHLDKSNDLLEWTKKNLLAGTMPIIQCKKYKCNCGLCAPKAQDRDSFINSMRKYRI